MAGLISPRLALLPPMRWIAQKFARRRRAFNLPGLKTANAIIPNQVACRHRCDDAAQRRVWRQRVWSAGAERRNAAGEPWLDNAALYVNGSPMEQFSPGGCRQCIVTKPEATYLVWLDFRDWGLDADSLNALLLRAAFISITVAWFLAKRHGIHAHEASTFVSAQAAGRSAPCGGRQNRTLDISGTYRRQTATMILAGDIGGVSRPDLCWHWFRPKSAACALLSKLVPAPH